ncbi:hypothetical protein CR513_22994, partial [Mucuna pruriens]
MHLQAFQTQVYINGGNDLLSCKLFLGLRVGPFSDSLALSRLASITEIKARAKKHVEAEEDKEDHLQAEKEMSVVGKKSTHGFQTNHQYNLGGVSWHEPHVKKYTPLKTSRAHILKEVYHLQPLNIPPPT